MGQAVLYERVGKVGIVKLNRPQALNAVNDELILDFVSALRQARDDKEARAIILKGEGRAFCAGADLKEGVRERTLANYMSRADNIQEIGRLMLKMGKPIVGAIHGHAVGAGMDFAVNCDIRIAAENAVFYSPETNVGTTVTTAVTKLLPAVIGLGKAFELFFTNRRLNAQEALEWNLVNKVVPQEELDKTVMEMAEKMTENYPLAMAQNRASTYNGLGVSIEEAFDEEASAASISFAAGERMTGMKKPLGDKSK
jgi:enoyl-CoA hydratase/carnithine racemase